MSFKTSWERYVSERREAGDDGFQPLTTRPRSKLFDSRTPALATSWYHGISGSTQNIVTTVSGRYRGEKYSLVDYITPGWKLLQSRGSIINNPVNSSREIWRRSQDPFSYRYTAGPITEELAISGYGTACFEYDNSPFVFDQQAALVDIEALKYRATISALGAVEPPQALALVTAFELNKTVNLIGDRARKLAQCLSIMASRLPPDVKYGRLLRAFGVTKRQKGIPNGPSKSATGLHELWLEWRYGWGPTVLDIEGLLKAAFTASREYHPRKTARGFAEDFQTRERSYAFSHNGSPSVGTFAGVETLRHEAVLRGYCLYDHSLATRGPNAFGIFAIPEFLWEITPYSFVVDWFVNVGDYLAAITPKVGVNLLASGITAFHRKSFKRQIVGSTNGSPWSPYVSPVGIQETLETRDFSRVTRLDVPTYPRIDVKINAKRTLDAIALLKGAVPVRR